jgi:membrane-associated protease RseP (regulator of RpoE activity)
MAYLAGVLFIVVGVAASIALHEIGHLVPAKRFGIKCTQYMVGFGPTVWSTKRGETEYGVKAIPLGGYVRMVGMFPPAPGKRARADSTGRLGTLIEQARHDSQREIGDEPPERLFYTKPVWQRLIVMFGGPTMNLVIGTVLLGVIMVGIGMTEQTTTLQTVSKCILPVTAAADAPCTASDPAAPAAAAGLQPGDKIVALNGKATSDWSEVQSAIRANPDRQIVLGIKRAGKRIDVRATPALSQRYALDGDGNQVLDGSGKPVLADVGFLGVTTTTDLVRQPITAVPGVLKDSLISTAAVVVRIPEKMVGVVKAIGGGDRDPTGPISVVGVTRLAGDVASTNSTSVKITFIDRLQNLLGLVMSLNLALFVFNLIPLLPLDGGHIAGALWEGLRRQVARLLKRPDPGPVDVARALPLAYGVASVLILFSVVLIYADLVNPIRLGG